MNIEVLKSKIQTTNNKVYDSIIQRFTNAGFVFTAQSISEYISLMTENGNAPSTINLHKSALKKYLKLTALTLETRFAIETFFADMKTVRQDKSIDSDKIISKEEFTKLIEQSKPQHRLIFQFLYMTGLRVHEMTSIKLTDIECINGKSKIRVIGKGKKQRTVLIHTALIEQIISEFKSTDYLFQTKNQKPLAERFVFTVVNRAGKRILKRHISPHTFRHSFATRQIVDLKKPLKAVSKYLGHSTTAITADLYCHTSLNIDDILEMM